MRARVRNTSLIRQSQPVAIVGTVIRHTEPVPYKKTTAAAAAGGALFTLN